ncbi:MAG TPA: TilS substrate-binding domain-containing protein, partial [Pyrinomonadaceae bacterium]|nr:TilS substrate-binding domain-containing protein [Pyrinomonadaceae bacterium]
VRRQLLPLLETFNPRAVETLGRTAALLRAEADALEHLGEKLLSEAGRAASLQAEGKRAAIAAERRSAAAEGDAVAAADERDAVVAADERDAVAAAAEGEAMREAGDAVADPPPPLSVEALRGADAAALGYALRGWIKSGRGNLRRIEAGHIEAVAGLLEGARGGRVAELPGGDWVERRRGLLLFRAGERSAGKS